MATETLNPNADGTTNQWSLSEGSSRSALVSDGDDDTYVYHDSSYVEGAHWWAIRIDGTTIYDADIEPGTTADFYDETDPTTNTREINSDNFDGCPALTKALITSLEIGMKASVITATKTQLFNLDDPTFPDDATINSATIHGRLSFNEDEEKSWIYQMWLVVDYTDAASTEQTLLKLKSGKITLQSGGKLTIK